MKLQPMTDFIEDQEKIIPATEHGPVKDWDRIFVQRTISYCRFLKQPLELGMLVPVDEEGNILGEPKFYEEFEKRNIEAPDRLWLQWEVECNYYKVANEKVLFEGFEIRKEKGKTYVSTPGYEIQLPLKNMTVEDLANNWSVELTPSALKTIGI